jgi:hypothetical protein
MVLNVMLYLPKEFELYSTVDKALLDFDGAEL